jgi:two-component system, cell cycle sensor histidine kinase and response regulator CckA
MITLGFQAKLLLAMMLLVVGVTATTLLITESQVRVSYERHFQQSFRFQMQSFLQQREARLAPVNGRVAEAASSPRLIAAMENAGHPGAEQQDVDDLYQNGVDQLLEIMKVYRRQQTNVEAGIFFFLNGNGQVLYPSANLKLPFSFPGLGQITQQVERVGLAVSREGIQQVGYLAPRQGPGRDRIREMVFTPVVDQVSERRLGVLAVGFPLPETESTPSVGDRSQSNRAVGSGSVGTGQGAVEGEGKVLTGIWLDRHLYSSSIPTNELSQLAKEMGGEVEGPGQSGTEFVVRLQGVPHQGYCQRLKTGSAFPPASQVCLYSLTEAAVEKQRFRKKILVSGTIALLAALGLSYLILRGLAVPLRELVAGTARIERGNYDVKVPVRSHDEIGQLAEAFNDMTERISASHLAQEQRIAERTQELAERKRGEEALRRSEASLREAQRIAHLGNWQWDLGTNALRWSEEIYSIFGLAPEQFKATYESFLERVHPDDREKVAHAVRQTLEAGQPYSLDHRVVRPDGEVRVVHERAEVIRDGAGRASQMVGTVQDITEQKRIEAEFLRAQRLDSVGALASGMAHDLNNALSPILMGIQLIRRQAQDPETREMLTVMEANTHRGADMVRQVLTFARGREADREYLNVGRLVREMENIVRQTLPKSITVATMVPPDLWPVLGNSTQLHQVLLNLCVNARDAMPRGGEMTLAADNVDLSADEAKGIPEAAPGCYVLLLVADTGTGIPPENLPRLFDRFFTTKDPGQGTGLGLSTVARIVRNHGGFVSVKSELDVGTTFEIYLPRAEAPVATVSAVAPAEIAPGRGELLLFIDDDRSVREMVGPTLTEHGYRVLSAANGAEALALLSQHEREVRLVLTDLAMPVMDGAATLEVVRARYPHLPVIVMSGSLDPGKERLPPGVAGFLPKPFPLEQLLAAIAKALQTMPG